MLPVHETEVIPIFSPTATVIMIELMYRTCEVPRNCDRVVVAEANVLSLYLSHRNGALPYSLFLAYD